MRRSFEKNIWYLLFLTAFTLFSAEIILRIYNPFPATVTGDRITLRTNTRQVFKNIKADDLDSMVVSQRNSLGFKGPERPSNFKNCLTILTVGGSTTECSIVNERKAWPNLVAEELNKSFQPLWLNNAGLNGHSTHGHIKLMQDYVIPLQPKVCIFLVGCNDVDRPELTPSDSTIFNKYQNPLVTLARYSRLANLALTLYWEYEAKQRELFGTAYSLKGQNQVLITNSAFQNELLRLKPDVERYGKRVSKIIELCKGANILPIFLTQPCVLGNVIDDKTSVDLSTYPYRKGNGKLYWAELQLYNEETKEICATENVKVIDLAMILPKSSHYFYDIVHFNNAGCKKISELISPELIQYLKDKFPQYSHSD